ncbi:MAG: M23 family metallopeptidase [Candidatus Hydrogenedentes bacterium]|nr:M23 family metallopeptidase [Candidatus Hydrogenedentota bacterium]
MYFSTENPLLKFIREIVFTAAAASLLFAWCISGAGCARTRLHSEEPESDLSSVPVLPYGSVPYPFFSLPVPQEEPAAEDIPAIWPVVKYTRISSPFGQKRRGGHFHKGIDLEARPGTDVVATAVGCITFSGRDGIYGNIIVIDHGNDYETAYAHLKRCMVDKGDKVQQGQKIGEVGATGNATGPHLHYEVRCKGVRVNPESWLP